MNKKQLLLGIIVAAFIAWFGLDLGQYLQLSWVQGKMGELRSWYAANPLLAGALYFGLYVAVTGLSIPGAAVMTLAGGALFGFWYALVLVSFGSSIGATIAFLISRTLLRDWVQQRFGQQLRPVNEGFAKDGAFYLFGLRLVPLFPFFVINLAMGLLPIGTWRYYWVSQLGMLPATAVYVNAGTQLGQLDSLAGIVSAPLLISFALLGVFPLLARRTLNALQNRRALAKWDKPKSFDTNMVVIGAGSAGLVSALIAATVRAKVTLVERDRMGGDCLNTGCVPSKALIRSARMAHYAQRASEFGLVPMDVQVRFADVMSRVRSVIATIEPHDSVERFTGLGVDCVQGEAQLVSPWEVEVNGDRIAARNIVVATGGRPRVPDIPGLEDVGYLTSDTVWELEQLPERLLVLGGGPIGCELAQAFARLGASVSIATRGSRLLPREDSEVSDVVEAAFTAEGISLHLGKQPEAFAPGVCRLEGGESIAFDAVLLAVGRSPNVEGLGLEALGVELNPAGHLDVDDFLRTRVPSIYAAGDVAGPYLFTHMASHQAWYASVNALFGRFRKFRVDYSVVPWATFIDPEVARVGLNEADAQAQGIAYEVSRYDLDDLDRAIADGEAKGFVKVLTKPGSDRILGATIVGYHAAELINEFVLAMKHGLGLNKILGTIHIYPTLSEGNKFLAGEWRKARKPEKLLDIVERYHRFNRGA
ncbi:pyridine nucleotide-disulfide oxidoreductase [Halioglobus japonicus]|uniref:Pyridine nucleotide-disulfide oxidoreductase n=1 Tax=Halioglobus japonicus TaxID=930805 RepID=A0AAP8MDP7_9GAMM|nr:FAD-dependent oxidoreductase [Halioglobus japonicus]PLW85902.1 pyridine nucleotide-disulfide oxidoreductase [Halioglobus japonicus]GHD18096.1 pyridine nucleotide-disulfide oxidoreductase [Halioglobus japonicus]